VAGVEATEFRFERWRRRTATGAVLTGIALGLREALESEKERPAMVQPVPGGDGDDDRGVDLYMDPEHPELTVAVVRPWLWH
jgi:hypothetical protein